MLADRSAFRKVSVLHAAGACASRGSKPRRASTSPCALCASSASTRSVATGRCSSCFASTNRACRPPTLSTNEVCTLLGAIRHPVRRRALCTIYALGFRPGEALRLETDHVDGERSRVWIRDGKGAKDPGVPLPRPLLARLRQYSKREQPPSATRYVFVPPNTRQLHETLQRSRKSSRRRH